MPVLVPISSLAGLLLIMALIFLLCSEEKYHFLRKIHREKKVGGMIGALALAWAGVQGYELLGQDFPAISNIIPIVIPLSIIGFVLLMDYVFTRAVGGLLILLLCELFYQGQVEAMPVRFVFSFMAYGFAILGMYMIGQPWRFRDLLFKSVESKTFGKKMALGITISTLIMFIPFIMMHV